MITTTSNEPWNTETHKTDREIFQSPITTMTSWTRWSKFLFSKRSAKMMDSSEKRKRQLTFKLQHSSAFEKRSNALTYSFIKATFTITLFAAVNHDHDHK